MMLTIFDFMEISTISVVFCLFFISRRSFLQHANMYSTFCLKEIKINKINFVGPIH